MVNNIKIDDDLDCYILNEQPTTCGKCGARTDFNEPTDEVQMHQCLNVHCGYRFLAVEDKR